MDFPLSPFASCLKAALRHRPDRIILGEIRGGEAFDLLQLLNTGHSGTNSTVHANSAVQGISRFMTCVLIGIGETVARPPLPHDRTCGSASGGSAS
jgi:Flp pilus assembly CpaF family ATPase